MSRAPTRSQSAHAMHRYCPTTSTCDCSSAPTAAPAMAETTRRPPAALCSMAGRGAADGARSASRWCSSADVASARTDRRAQGVVRATPQRLRTSIRATTWPHVAARRPRHRVAMLDASHVVERSPMLIRHLTYFIALAREQHFARAAEACSVTQPTLTAAIKKLEEDLGVRLVIRDHRFVRLTEEGEKLLLWGRQILVDYGSLKDDLAGLRRGLVGTLHLGVIPAAMAAVSFLTSRFTAAHPEANVEIRSMTSRAIERALEAFEIDAGVTYLDNEPLQHVRKVTLYRERYVFACRREHSASTNATITWKEAAARRLCLLSEDMQNRRIINKVAASIGVDIKADVVGQFVPCRALAHPSRRVGQHRAAHVRPPVYRQRRRDCHRPGRTKSHSNDRPRAFRPRATLANRGSTAELGRERRLRARPRPRLIDLFYQAFQPFDWTSDWPVPEYVAFALVYG